MAAALLDDLGQADDLGAGAHDDEQLQSAVVLECDIGIVLAHAARPPRSRCRGSRGRRARWPT